MEFKVRSEDSNVEILELRGRMDTYSVPGVRQWLKDATEGPPARIVINLGGVHFIDSTALATFVQAMKRSRRHDGDVRLCNLQQPVRMIFELTRLDKAFEIYLEEDDALAAFHRSAVEEPGSETLQDRPVVQQQ